MTSAGSFLGLAIIQGTEWKEKEGKEEEKAMKEQREKTKEGKIRKEKVLDASPEPFLLQSSRLMKHVRLTCWLHGLCV